MMYTKNRHIHFVGIGGIGMSGLALLLKQQGYTVSGCDPDLSQDTIPPLINIGCTVYQNNNSDKCDDPSIDILVYIPMYANTIPAITAEIERARERNIVTVTRAQMLAELMRTKFSIAVSGSHGKTTTSALIAHILLSASYDPTVVVGGNLKNIGSNAHLGTGEFFVAEADESDRSFLQLNPTITVVTNINKEHLETYKDLNDIKNTYKQFMQNVPFYGKTVACIDDEHTRSLLQKICVKTITYGITDHHANIRAHDITLHKNYSTFRVVENNTLELGTIMLPIAGIHNVYNALAAVAVTLDIGISFDTIRTSLATFAGVDRRFAFHGMYKNAEIFDDYGHHPKEIETVLTVARKRAKNRLIVIFQPHRYTRTEKLWNDFIRTLTSSFVDELIITDIYSAGEAPIATITSKRLAQELLLIKTSTAIHYVPFEDTFDQLRQKIDQLVHPDDLLLFLGAGKMHLLAAQLKNAL